LEPLLSEIVGTDAFMREEKYNFSQNLLIPSFMESVEDLTGYLHKKDYTLKEREKDFISRLYKIFAMVAGEALGAFYHEAKTLNRLTSHLKRTDYILGKGV